MAQASAAPAHTVVVATTVMADTVVATATVELSKTERRRQAKKRKKERLLMEKAAHGGTLPRKRKAKITKEERKEKYTLKARVRREAKMDKGREKDMVCFHCRKKGHAALHCPEAEGNAHLDDICYKCGSTEHRLQSCPKRKKSQKSGQYYGDEDDLPYATCFVCKQSGHLSSQCKANTKGVFVSGSGSCRICGEKDHVAKHCPNRPDDDDIQQEKETPVASSDLISSSDATGRGGGDEDPGLSREDECIPCPTTKRRKVVRF